MAAVLRSGDALSISTAGIFFRAFSVFLLGGGLTGCGIGGLCQNECPAGWVHGSVDCGCMEKIKDSSPAEGVPNSAYIVRRYYCVDSANGRTDRGTCDVTRQAGSCAQAMDDIAGLTNGGPDPCVHCNPKDRDNTKKWNGNFDDIQGGPCQGWSSLRPPMSSPEFGIALYQTAKGWSEQTWSYRLARARVALGTGTVRFLRLVSEAPADNSPASCKKECSDASPLYCFVVNLEPQESVGFKKLYSELVNSPAEIPEKELQQYFGYNGNDCPRGGTVFSGGLLSNSGDACTLSATTPETSVRMDIPELLQGSWGFDQDEVAVRFGNPQTRATLHFSDDGLDQDWGGDVVAAYGTLDYVGFSVGTKSCVRANLQNQ